MEDDSKRSRAKKKLLRVTFPDGTVYCYSSAASTMVATLVKVGTDKFPLIKLDVCHLPLLSKGIYPQYEKYMKPVCDGWYINTQPNTDFKYLQLRAINSQLRLGLKIELGDDFEAAAAPDREPRSMHKTRLWVEFPDGEVVDRNSAVETFLECVRKFGVEDIKNKELLWGGYPLITPNHVLRSQVQVDRNWWIIVPNVTKDKVKLLRVISAKLHTKLEISIV